MTWHSEHNPHREYEDIDFSDIGRYDYQNSQNKNMWTRHNLCTYAFWACVIVIGVLQALKGQGVGDFTTLIGILGGLEHTFAGNTGTPTS